MSKIHTLHLQKDSTRMEQVQKSAEALRALPDAIDEVDRLICEVIKAKDLAVDAGMPKKVVAGHVRALRKLRAKCAKLRGAEKAVHIDLQSDMEALGEANEFRATAGPITREL